MSLRASGVLLVLAASAAHAHAAPVTIFLDRYGQVTDDGTEIPPFGGGDRVWRALVACVRERYAPFAVDVVDGQPRGGHYITAVIGGKASLLGLDDRTTNGVGPFSGHVERDAVVHIFSRVGTGERDVENLCAVTAHEVGHALGLDHEIYCGDIMSYYLDRCGARTFVDDNAYCGETRARRCGAGGRTQNSYRRLGELVGFRTGRQSEPEPEPQQTDPSGDEPQDDPWDTPAPQDDPETTAAPQDPYGDEPVPVDPYAADEVRPPQQSCDHHAPAAKPRHRVATKHRVIVVRRRRR